MASGGHCSVRLTRRYPEPPAEVWRALTDLESQSRWLRPGFEVRQTAVEPERILQLDWAPPGEEPSVVTVELRAEGDGTVLVLDHARIEARRGMRAAQFWTEAVGRLPLKGRS